jgi:hypothetical protein
MARASLRTLILILRLRVPETSRDLGWNNTEINRVLAIERIDPDAALIILWAKDQTTAALGAESARRPAVLKIALLTVVGSIDVPLNPLFPESLSEILTQMIENTKQAGVNQSGELAHPAWYRPPRKV